MRDGLVRRDEIKHRLPVGIQGIVMNTRRPMFADPRVREAIGQVFDFEWMNKNLFFGSYVRTHSYFGNTAQESTGLPDADEQALLAPFRDKLPLALFTEPFQMPSTDASGNNREGLRRALVLLKEAGWTIKDRKLVDGSGKQMADRTCTGGKTYQAHCVLYCRLPRHRQAQAAASGSGRASPRLTGRERGRSPGCARPARWQADARCG